MRTGIYGLSVVGVLSVACLHTRAAIMIVDPSFESMTLADGADDYAGANNPPSQNIPGWTVDRNDVAVFNPTSTQFAGESTLDGSNVIFMNSGIIHQDLGTMVAGQTYTFDVSYGWRSDLPSNLDAQQFAFILRPSISSSTALVISESAAFNEPEPSGAAIFTAPTPTSSGTLTYDTFSYTATAADDGQPLTLQLQATDLQLLVDQVQLTTSSVPEPATLGMLGLAGTALLARRRK